VGINHIDTNKQVGGNKYLVFTTPKLNICPTSEDACSLIRKKI